MRLDAFFGLFYIIMIINYIAGFWNQIDAHDIIACSILLIAIGLVTLIAVLIELEKRIEERLNLIALMDACRRVEEKLNSMALRSNLRVVADECKQLWDME